MFQDQKKNKLQLTKTKSPFQNVRKFRTKVTHFQTKKKLCGLLGYKNIKSSIEIINLYVYERELKLLCDKLLFYYPKRVRNFTGALKLDALLRNKKLARLNLLFVDENIL